MERCFGGSVGVGRRTSWAGVVGVVAVMAVTGCGSSGSSSAGGGSSSGSGSSGSSAIVATETLDQAKEAAKLVGPTPTGPKAVAGKNVWFIGCGSKFEACADGITYFKDAAKHLGWKVTAPDTQLSPPIYSQAIRSAIADKADAIVVESMSCPQIKNAMQAARAAKIPVVGLFGLDCDNPVYGKGGQSLQVTPRYGGTTDVAQLFQQRGASDARIILAELKEAGVAKPSISYINWLDEPYWAIYWKAWLAGVKKGCPGCTLNNVNFNIAQYPNPATQIVQTGLNAHPNANAVQYSSDLVLQSSLIGSIFSKGKIVCCGDGLTPSRDKVRAGTMKLTNSGTLLPWEMMSWGTADTVNRLLAGEDPAKLPNEGSGFAYVDKASVGTSDGPVGVTVDFKSTYIKMWGGA